MAGEQDTNKTPAQSGAGTAPGAESGGKQGGIDSASKTSDEAQGQAQQGIPGSKEGAKAAERGVTLNHGEPDPFIEQQRKNQLEASKDPWGTTPLQMRDSHDEAVDPDKVGIATRSDGSGLVDADGNPKARPIAPSGIEPGVAGDKAPQGTLPPV